MAASPELSAAPPSCCGLGRRWELLATSTTLPSTVSRQAALSLLHDHEAMMDLNPLVLWHRPTAAPGGTPAAEADWAWFTVADGLVRRPGGGRALGQLRYLCGFADAPDGLQTHSLAPLGVELRGRWTVVAGPDAALSLREAVELRCCWLLAGAVRRTLKRAHAGLVRRIIARAEAAATATGPEPGDRLLAPG